ncbi:MAG: xanthine dehydrogenase molybdopterin binding subunit [Planctomycetes bacterium]|nr:xanthine dehydrogenase molybdopterin binding subunit [Planctomycetota bacterium]
MATVGQSIAHDSAREHVRGEAAYIDDLPPLRGELCVDFVGSPVAHGRIRSIDVAAAHAMPGIVAIYTFADVNGHNDFGPIFHDEELLAKEIVHFHGQPIVLLAGESRAAIEAAKKKCQIDIEPLPAVLTIDDAISREQFIGPTRRIERGDIGALTTAECRLSGEFRIGGQEHFYLEAQAAIAIPGEAGEITVHSSTQNPTEIQEVVAHCLGLPSAKVVCVCKRMGGGFGGKETQAALPALFASLVAFKTRRSARIVFGHEQDFHITGKRHPYRNRYEVGFTREGKIIALKAEFHSNGGFSADLSLAIMERTLLHSENAYFIPNVLVTGTVCRTNLPSNTAFRGFGGPQGVAAIENVIEEIATHLGIDAYQIRRLNCYGTESNNVTPYGQLVRNNTLPRVLDQLVVSSDYDRRKSAIAMSNAVSKTRLRGIALTPVKFGISFTRRTLNQGNALVNVYKDGTVQVSSGGTEMGQGLNIKLAQIVAEILGLPIAMVRVMPTSTEKNNNTSPTAASASTDLNGAAAAKAARAIRARLAETGALLLADVGLEASPDSVDFDRGFISDRRRPSKRIPFVEVVKAAYEARIDLGERAFFATPGVDYNRETGRGTPFRYFTNGAAVAEVVIDRFTGNVRVERVDLLMDIGRPLNPAIDRGQIIGGFVQGMGWVTTETLRYGPGGELWSDSATTYKIPNVSDIPADFRYEVLADSDVPENIYGSKAVGEPPLLLGIAVWAAIKSALASRTPGRSVNLELPATNEEVLRCLSIKCECSQVERARS